MAKWLRLMRKAVRRSSFCKRARWKRRKSPVYFYAFDLLQLDGKSLLSLPLEVRKERSGETVCRRGDPRFDTPARLVDDANQLLKEVQRRGWKESSANNTTPFTNPAVEAVPGSSSNVSTNRNSSLADTRRRRVRESILAQFSSATTKITNLVFAGKVGTGFTTKSLATLHKKFRADERADCPFVDLPSKQNGQWVLGITPSMMKKIHWINPKFVAEIKFAEWTRDGKLRAPVFLGVAKIKNRAKLFAKRHLLDRLCASGPVRSDAFLEAERQSVRAFSLAYSNIKSRENRSRGSRGIDNCLCYRQG